MSRTTENYDLKIFDFENDSTQSFVNGVAGINDSNMQKIDAILKSLSDRIAELEKK